MSWPFRKPHPESLAVGAVLTAMIALGQLSTAIYVPSMPSLVETFATTGERVGLTLTVFLAGFAVSQLIFGPLSDRYGRYWVLLSGVVVFLGASLGCMLSDSIGTLIFWRLVQSVGACSGAVLGRAIVRDIYGRERAAKAMAYIGIAFSVSPAVSPIIGGELQVWFGWRASFAFLAIISLILLVLTAALLSETNRERDPHALNPVAMMRNFRTLLSSPVFVGYMLSLSFVFSGLMAFVASAPFLFVDALGFRPDHFGMIAALSAAGTLGGNLSAGMLTTRLGPARMVFIGILLTLAGGTFMAATGAAGIFHFVPITIAVLIFLWGMGIVMPNAMAGAIGPFPRMAGAASALLGFVQMAVGGIAAQVSTALPHDSQWPLGLLMLGLATVALISYLTIIRPQAGKAAPPH